MPAAPPPTPPCDTVWQNWKDYMGGASSATIQGWLADGVELHDYDVNVSKLGKKDVADYLVQILPDIDKHADAQIRNVGTTTCLCLNHMTRPNHGQCVDVVTVDPTNGNKVTRIEICATKQQGTYQV